MARRPRAALRVLFVVGGLIASSVDATLAADLPLDRQVLILTRALAYDSNLKDRVGADVFIGVAAKAGGAQQGPDSIAAAFQAISGARIAGLPLKVTRLGYTNRAQFAASVQELGIDVVVVCPGLEGDLPAILELSHERHMLTVGTREEHLTKGASLGAFVVDGKPTIMVNLPASKAEGASFSLDLLRVAKVIR
jgi:hypothetical protein